MQPFSPGGGDFYETPETKAVEDLNPRTIGIIRDQIRTWRTDAGANREMIDIWENKIDQWNELNPEYRAFRDELTMANKGLDRLLKERQELRERLKIEDGADLEEQLARTEMQIEKYGNDITRVQGKLASTRALVDVLRDKTLPLKTKMIELFKRRGLTIAALLTAVGLSISTLALAVKGGSAAASGGGAAGGVTPSAGRSKTALETLAKWLRALAEKSAAAIPGLIGTIVSFILKTAGSAVSFIGEQLWLFVTAAIFFVITKYAI